MDKDYAIDMCYEEPYTPTKPTSELIFDFFYASNNLLLVPFDPLTIKERINSAWNLEYITSVLERMVGKEEIGRTECGQYYGFI